MMEWYAGLMARGNAPQLVRDGREMTGLRTGKFKLKGTGEGTSLAGSPSTAATSPGRAAGLTGRLTS
jgi:hypothetical protein